MDRIKELNIYNKSFIEGDLVEIFTENEIIKCYIEKIGRHYVLVQEIIYKKTINIKLKDIENIFSMHP